MCLSTTRRVPLIASMDIPVIKVLACIKSYTADGKPRYAFVGPFGYNDNFTYTPRPGAIMRQPMATTHRFGSPHSSRRRQAIGPGLHSYKKEVIEILHASPVPACDGPRPEILVSFVVPAGTPYYTEGDRVVSDQLRWVKVLTPLKDMHHSVRNALFDANGELPQ